MKKIEPNRLKSEIRTTFVNETSQIEIASHLSNFFETDIIDECVGVSHAWFDPTKMCLDKI